MINIRIARPPSQELRRARGTVAIQHNQPIRAFYERLVKAGKPKMTAVVACMRKLLTLINLLVAKKEHWKPKVA